MYLHQPLYFHLPLSGVGVLVGERVGVSVDINPYQETHFWPGFTLNLIFKKSTKMSFTQLNQYINRSPTLTQQQVHLLFS